MIVVVSS